MKILVTGGSGFIGTNFIKYWFQKYPKDEITNLDKLTYAANPKNLAEQANLPNYKFVVGDICDRDLVNDITKGMDLIVHFAAESHVDRSIEGPFTFLKNNVEGTLALLEAAKQNGNIRFHHISTDEVFGDLPLENPDLKFTEHSKLNPRTPYSASKASAENFVRTYFETYKLPITISNCSNNYGPYQYPEKLIPLTIIRAMYDEKIPVYGDGLQVRDWIHVEDHCIGIDQIIKNGQIGQTYLLGGDSERTNLAVIKEILKSLAKSEDLIQHVGDRKGHDVRYAIDFSKAEKELNFKPKYTFEDGLAETISWYKDNKVWWEDKVGEVNEIAEKYLKQ